MKLMLGLFQIFTVEKILFNEMFRWLRRHAEALIKLQVKDGRDTVGRGNHNGLV